MKKFWTLLIIGYVISVFAGGFFLYLLKETSVNSLTLTLLGLILTTLLAFIADTNKNQEEIRRNADQNHTEIRAEMGRYHDQSRAEMNNYQNGVLDACGISRYLNQDRNLTEAFHKLPGYYIAATSNSSDKIFGERAHAALETCVETFAELAKGRVNVAEDERLHYMFSRLDETSDGLIKVVTWLSHRTYETDWWKNNIEGRKYLEKQKEAISNRNVKIIRIIITSNQTPEDLKQFVSAQKEIGIKVMTIREDALHDRDLKVNFLICKDCWVTESDSDVHGVSKGGIVSTNYEIDVYPRLRIWNRLSIQPALTEIIDVERDIE